MKNIKANLKSFREGVINFAMGTAILVIFWVVTKWDKDFGSEL